MVGAVLFSGLGCDAESSGRGEVAPEPSECVGAKCDTPVGEGEDLCKGRRDAAFTKGKEAFVSTALRWSCSDVPGVTVEDRGQEYCEYWAVARLGDETLALGRLEGSGESDVGLAFTPEQQETLEALPSTEVIGACVFSSWNGDKDATCDDCEGILDLPATAEHFQARKSFNTLAAAEDLLKLCGDGTAPSGELRDDSFYRGCLHAHDAFGTGWRKSDATICSAAVALSECGCQLPDGAPLTTLARPDKPGFQLGSWADADAVPSGCHYVDIDDDSSRVVVACEVTASQVLDQGHDLKSWCRQQFAERIVVHVPIDPSAVQCDASCSAEPWVLSN